MVTKSNALIMASYNLSTHEQKLILTLASLVQPKDEDFKAYSFKIRDFMSLLGVSNQSRYNDTAKITKNLMKKVLEIREDNQLKQVAWLCSAVYKFGEGIVTLKFAPELKEHLLYLKEFYTTYRLENVLTLKSKYSIRLYEILKSNMYKGVMTISLEELKKMVGATAKYFKVYQDFKIKVLLQSQKEINEKTDIEFEFMEVREWRKIMAIQFKTRPKLNHEFKNQATVYDVIYESDEEPDNLIGRVNRTLGVKFDLNSFKKLVKEKGIEKIEFYLDNWHKFDCTGKKSIAGFFYHAVMGEYELPKQEKGIGFKPIQATNYQQREYDDDYYESLYDNPDYKK